MSWPPREISPHSESFAAHSLVFIAPPGHPLMQVAQVPVYGLKPYALIAREHGSCMRRAMEAFFARNVSMTLRHHSS